MIDTKDKQKSQRQTIQAEREGLQQATQRFIVSLVRTGGSIALLPVTRLPHEPRQHFLAAGREFTNGWAFVVREFADYIEGLSKVNGTSTHDGAGAHPTGTEGDSQET